MSDLQSREKFVRYPRKTFGMEYGSLARLESLGNFCSALSITLVGIAFLTILLEVSIGGFSNHHGLLEAALVSLVAFPTGRWIIRRSALLARGMGWNRAFEIAVCLAFLSLDVIPYIWPDRLGWFCVVPPIAVIVLGGIGLELANTEMTRYGVKISRSSVANSQMSFLKTVAQRRAFERNPSPPSPVEIFSGDPPSR